MKHGSYQNEDNDQSPLIVTSTSNQEWNRRNGSRRSLRVLAAVLFGLAFFSVRRYSSSGNYYFITSQVHLPFPFEADLSPAVTCCQQKGGIYRIVYGNGQSGICDYNGYLIGENYFLNNYCAVEKTCVQDGTDGFEVTCLDCCVDKFHYGKDACNLDDSCLQDNMNAFENCEDSCVEKCEDYCFDHFTTCIDECGNVEDGQLRKNCKRTCKEQYDSCKDKCTDERLHSEGSV